MKWLRQGQHMIHFVDIRCSGVIAAFWSVEELLLAIDYGEVVFVDVQE